MMSFSSVAQVDAVAACSRSHVLLPGPEDKVKASETSLLAVAQSQLEGNVWGGRVGLFEATTSELLCELELDSGVASLAWCGVDGDLLAMGCDDGAVRLARLSGDVAWTFGPRTANDSMGKENATETGWGHDDVITGVSASRSHKTHVATCSWDLTVKLWDVGAVDKTVATFHGHTDLIWGVAMNPMHAPLLCSASQDTTVHVWDVRRPRSAALVVSTFLPALSVDWHPRQSTVFSVGLENGMVCTFDVRSPHTPLTRREIHGAAVHAVKYSPYHDDLLASGGDDGKAFVTTDSFASDRAVGSGVRELLGRKEKSAPHRDYVRALEWFKVASAGPASEDKEFDTLLATGSWDKIVHKWSANDYSAPVGDEEVLANISKATMSAVPPGVPVAYCHAHELAGRPQIRSISEETIT